MEEEENQPELTEEQTAFETEDAGDTQTAKETQEPGGHIDLHEESKASKSEVRNNLISWFKDVMSSQSFVTITDEIFELIREKHQMKEAIKSMQWILNTIISKSSKK